MAKSAPFIIYASTRVSPSSMEISALFYNVSTAAEGGGGRGDTMLIGDEAKSSCRW
jgi:hypothetical protein